MSLVIGLTGSIASGKSTVSQMFDDYSIPVVDADKLAREVVEPGQTAYKQVVDTFGETILREDKSLNRPALGQIIFADESKRKLLNGIVHPAIRERMLERRDFYLNAGVKCVVLDIPLLFESELSHFADRTIVVSVDETVQLKRLMERDNYTEKEAWQRIRSQMPIEEKVRMADAVIDNNGSIKESRSQLEELLKDWQIL
ncbi:dephospho-CoA kinase [Oceanobacillus massiliensis]|uniref:dephospho-CoA kinase n=1 Tax=Oceanobacillus massiliensis TaxID=1465765 RepID=UPI0002893B0A|nr:dephospho-CoA kinase [Oceanobacillus massiliensis]